MPYDPTHPDYQPVTPYLLDELRKQASATCPPLTEEEQALWERVTPATHPQLIEQLWDDPRFLAAEETRDAATRRMMDTCLRADIVAGFVATNQVRRTEVAIIRDLLAADMEEDR